MRKTILFSIAVLVLVGGLKVLNWIPTALNGPGTISYSNLESLPASLRAAGVYRPTYFPESLEWPPAEILTREHGHSLLMHFRNRKTERIELAISQSGDGAAPLPTRIDPTTILSERPLDLNNRPARLVRAICADQKPCNKLMWDEGAMKLFVI